MRTIDWIVLAGTLAVIVAYGVWKGRHKKDLHGCLLAGRQLKWPTIALSIILKETVKDFYSAEAQVFPTVLPDRVVTRPFLFLALEAERVAYTVTAEPRGNV